MAWRGVRECRAKPHDFDNVRSSKGRCNETRSLSLMSTLRVNSGPENKKRPPEGGLSERDDACRQATCTPSPADQMSQPTLARTFYKALARSVKLKSQLQPRNNESVACTTQQADHSRTLYSNATLRDRSLRIMFLRRLGWRRPSDDWHRRPVCSY